MDLGDAETIDNAAVAFLNATRVPNSEQRVQTTGRQLDELLMAPIRPLLGDATHLLLSPDGQLNLIPFAALVDEENRYLVESYQLTHLTTGRDLLRLQYPRPSRQPPVLFANPNYDDADTSAVMQVTQATRGESQRSMEIEDLQFGELPGTQREVEAIAPPSRQSHRSYRGAGNRKCTQTGSGSQYSPFSYPWFLSPGCGVCPPSAYDGFHSGGRLS